MSEKLDIEAIRERMQKARRGVTFGFYEDAERLLAEVERLRSEVGEWRACGQQALVQAMRESAAKVAEHDLSQGCVGCPCSDDGGVRYDPWCVFDGIGDYPDAFWGKPAPATCPLRKGPIVICAADEKKEEKT